MAGEIDRTKGQIKEKTGELVDDDSLKREGEIDQVKGKAKDLTDKVRQVLKD